MKKILLIIISMCFVSWAAQSAKMCAESDAVVIPYGTGVETSSNYAYWPTNYNSGTTWTVPTYYGMLMGISACLPSSQNTSTDNINTSVSANGGEQAGLYCWCKMLHPVSSYWMYRESMSNMTNCVSGCAQRCGIGVYSSSTARNNMLSAATN